MDLENLTRRSFLKKTTVLTVGVASMTLFSGLVNAEDEYDDDCTQAEMNSAVGIGTIEPTAEDSNGKDTKCEQTLTCADGKKCTKKITCTEWHPSPDDKVCKLINTED